MDSDRLARVMARIEAAATRIEAAAGTSGASTMPPDPELQTRYTRLREEASLALSDLDALIAGLEA